MSLKYDFDKLKNFCTTKQQEAIISLLAEGKTYSEVAVILDKTYESIRWVVRRIRAKAKEANKNNVNNIDVLKVIKQAVEETINNSK